MATKRSVLWSKEMFSPVDLKEKFKEHFPVIVMVARGYYGQTEIDTLGSDQVLILQGWSSQKRVVAKDTRGRYISIPADYPLKFEITSRTDQDLYLRPVSSRARPLWQIIETQKLPIRVQFDRQVSSCFYVGANPRCTETFGELEVIAVYDENYLKGNTINAGKIDTDAITVVPMYMKTHFVIAEGLKGTPPNLWENMRQHYITRVQHLDFNNVNGNMDIMLYDGQAIGSTEYDLLMPKSYVRHPSIGAISGRFSSEGTIKTVTKCEPKYYPLKTRSSSTSEQDAQRDSQREEQVCPVHAPINEQLYTGLTHSRPRTNSQTSSGSGSSHMANGGGGAYRPRANDMSNSSPSRRPAPVIIKGGLTRENQGELVQALQNLSVSRQARLSDSSTDSSTTTTSEQSSTSPAKLASPCHQHHNGCVHTVASPMRRPPQPRTHLHSESDSGKGSQYTAEDLISSDDSDDVFYNSEEAAVRNKCRSMTSRMALHPIRRNRSESDAPRDMHQVYGAADVRSSNSCSTSCLPTIIDNVAYFSVGQGLKINGKFRSLDDIPEDITPLTVDEVAECLRLLNLGMYVRKFVDYQVDGELLKAFNYEDLHKEFGISVVNAKKIERFAKHGWRPRLNASPGGSPIKTLQKT